jgi:ribosomal protein S12 methylthiotransferase accessory factor
MKKLERTEPFPVFTAFTAATLHTAFSMAAQMIAEWIVHPDDHALKGKIISLDIRSWKRTQHALPMLPQCPVCGDQKEHCTNDAREPIRLRSDRIRFQEDGGYRIRHPEDTIAEFAHLISPITGIVSVLEKEEGVDSLAPLYRAGHNNALRYDSSSSLKRWSRSLSGGKGMTDLQAKASGLCEAIERYCGVYQGCEQRVTSSLTRLGSDAVHPYSCMLYSKDQYRNRETINAEQSRCNHVPEPFNDPDKQIEWSPVWSLTHETFRYLPTQFLYYQYRYPDEGILPVYFSACSNGAASGNSIEEAVLQGFLELAERDGVALWWYNMLPRSTVDLASFQVSYFLELKAFYRSIHRELWVIDITSDLDIPIFAALSRRIDIPEEQILFGFGAHLNARLAIQRALTEMNQSLPIVNFAMGGDGSADAGFGNTEAIRWWQTATVENQPYLVSDRSLPSRCAEDFRQDVGDDLLEKIEFCRGAIEAQGLEMLVLDQTRPGIGLPVVKVIVPGLRHFWTRFAPGRLYDVPVKMGWLDKPRKEMDLNQVAMFM